MTMKNICKEVPHDLALFSSLVLKKKKKSCNQFDSEPISKIFLY